MTTLTILHNLFRWVNKKMLRNLYMLRNLSINHSTLVCSREKCYKIFVEIVIFGEK